MKKLFVTTVLAALGVSFVQAQPVDVYIVGATAFRANAFRSLTNLYGANLTSKNPAAANGSQNRYTLQGTIPSLFSTRVVTVFASHSGSVEGIQTLDQNLTTNEFLPAVTGTTLFTHRGDLAFSDAAQSSTIYQATALEPSGGGSAAAVGVLPFVWVRSSGTPSTVNNINRAQARTLFANGLDTLSGFTANVADASEVIFLVGRNVGSGTRLIAELCNDVVPGSHSQYTTNGPACGDWILFNGFSSGSGIVTVLNSTCGQQTNAIGYMSIPDAQTAVLGGASLVMQQGEFPFTGTFLTTSTTTTNTAYFNPLIKGRYDWWSYEQLYYDNEISSGDARVTFRNALASGIDSDLATSASAVPISVMRCLRLNDGSEVVPF